MIIKNHKFVATNYPQYLNLYDRVGREIKFICSVDLFRYLWRYKYNGACMDLDYEIIKLLDYEIIKSLDYEIIKLLDDHFIKDVDIYI